MELIFAKWMIFAATLVAGKAQDFPIMEVERSTPHISSPVMVSGTWSPGTPCHISQPNCVPKPPGPVGSVQTQHFCLLTPGIYTVNFRLGLEGMGVGEYASGSVSFEHVGEPVKTVAPSRVHLFDFYGIEGWPSTYATSFSIVAEQPACFVLRYTASSQVKIDPSKTFLTVHRG